MMERISLTDPNALIRINSIDKQLELALSELNYSPVGVKLIVERRLNLMDVDTLVLIETNNLAKAVGYALSSNEVNRIILAVKNGSPYSHLLSDTVSGFPKTLHELVKMIVAGTNLQKLNKIRYVQGEVKWHAQITGFQFSGIWQDLCFHANQDTKIINYRSPDIDYCAYCKYAESIINDPLEALHQIYFENHIKVVQAITRLRGLGIPIQNSIIQSAFQIVQESDRWLPDNEIGNEVDVFPLFKDIYEFKRNYILPQIDSQQISMF